MTQEGKHICDWKNKVDFESCLVEEFLSADFHKVHEFLKGEGFAVLDRGDYWYYQNSTNEISNYKVAVIVKTSDDNTVSSIEIR